MDFSFTGFVHIWAACAAWMKRADLVSDVCTAHMHTYPCIHSFMHMLYIPPHNSPMLVGACEYFNQPFKFRIVTTDSAR